MQPLLQGTPAQTAQDLYKEIRDVQTLISSWEPELQLSTVQQTFDHEKRLEECTEKAHALYHHGVLKEISDISDEEYQSFLVQVQKSASILLAIKTNYDFAQQICSLAKETEEALETGSPNPHLLASLAGQVEDLFSQSEMNVGNHNAVRSLLGRIFCCERPMSPAPTLKRSPAIQLPHPNQLQIEEDRKIREEQDLVFEICQRKDEFNELCRHLQSIPLSDFNMLISFYAGVKQEFENAEPVSPHIKQLMQTVLDQIQKEIQRVIALQQGVDEAQAKTAQNREALEALKSALETANEQSTVKNCNYQQIGDTVEAVFKKLSFDLKTELLEVFNRVLKTKPEWQKAVPKTLLDKPFFTWSNSYPNRLEAVQELIALLPKIPSGPSLSCQMIEKLKIVMAPSAKCEYEESVALFRKSIAKLLSWIPCLSDLAGSNQLYNVVEDLTSMISEGEQFSFTFNIGGAALCTVPDRLFFHLSCIHKQQRPEQFVADDPMYGQQAICGGYPTTNLERRQAILRTVIELTLIQFSVACQQGDEETTLNSKQQLVEMQKLAGTDMPAGILHKFIMNTHPFKGEGRIEDIIRFQKSLAAIWKLV
jgi:hypothetical protein